MTDCRALVSSLPSTITLLRGGNGFRISSGSWRIPKRFGWMDGGNDKRVDERWTLQLVNQFM